MVAREGSMLVMLIGDRDPRSARRRRREERREGWRVEGGIYLPTCQLSQMFC